MCNGVSDGCGRRSASPSNRRKWERGCAALYESGNSSGGRCDLERRNGIERDAIAEANHALAVATEKTVQETRFEIRAVGKAKTRSNRPIEASSVPAFGRHKGDCAGLIFGGSCGQRRADNWRTRHEDVVMRRRVTGRIEFPPRAIIERHVRSHLPLVLEVEVVLIKVMLLRIQRNVIACLERQKHIILQIGDESLRNSRGQAIQGGDEIAEGS